MKVIIAFAIFIVAAFAVNQQQQQFVQWMQQHQKSYSNDEFQYRYRVWKKNSDFIANHNAAGKNFSVAMNKFGDLTNTEFAQIFLGVKMTAKPSMASILAENTTALPTSFDWSKKGAVTPIKNQQQCGSCWSFSTTGSVEGCHFLAAGKLVSLSEQNLMDCSFNQGNQGCDGGLMTQAMDYIISNGGIDTESSYPYTAEDGTCNYNAANSGATLKKYTNVAQGSESGLQTAVSQGPTSVAIDASHSSFQFYSSGVYSEPDCSSSQLDHGVLAVGWGVSGSTDYWIVKNSWGTDWGQNGYIWMTRNSNNQCGIATMATLPSC